MNLQFAKIGSHFRLFSAAGNENEDVEIVGCCGGDFEEAEVWFSELRQQLLDIPEVSLELLEGVINVKDEEPVAYGVVVKAGGRILVVSQRLQWYLIRNGEVFRMAEGEGLESFSGWCKAKDELVCLVRSEDLEFATGMKREEFIMALQNIDVHGGVVMVPADVESQTLPQPAVMPIKQPDPSLYSQSGVASQPVDEGLDMVESVGKQRWSMGFLKSFVRLLPREDSIYLLQENLDVDRQKRGKRMLFLTSILLLLVLGGVVLYGIKQRKERVFEFTFGGTLAQIQYKITVGSQIAELNPVRARELIGEVEGLISTLESRGFDPTELSEWKAQLLKLRGIAQRKYAVEPTVWYTLALARENMRGVDFYGTDESLFVLDGSENRVVEFTITSKSRSVLAGQQAIGEALSLAANAQGVYVIGDKGLVEIVNKKESVISGDISDISGINDLQTYGSNVYVLSNNGVWRWSMTEDGWNGPNQWLDEDALSDWRAPNGSGIDGMIWVATQDGVWKYIRGVQESFSIQGLEEGLVQADDLYTDENTSRLYILDKGSKRVVVVDKESGIYEMAYTWDGLDQVIGIHVHEEMKKMWWVTEEVIYEVGIR